MVSMPNQHATYFAYNMPFGRMTIATDGQAITHVALGEITYDGSSTPTSITNACATELLEYFAGKRTIFDLPLAPQGTTFQKETWSAIQKIPYGQTITYQDLAKMMGREGAHRSLGSAIKANPIIVMIPAHRVITANANAKGDIHAKIRAAFRELEARNAR